MLPSGWGDGNSAMTDDNCQSVAWNAEARISCEFAFKCPKAWGCLEPTADEGVRHCPECDRDVHLALTEADFRRHADEGHCVAVRVLQVNVPKEDRKEVFMVGNAEVPYNAHLKSL